MLVRFFISLSLILAYSLGTPPPASASDRPKTFKNPWSHHIWKYHGKKRRMRHGMMYWGRSGPFPIRIDKAAAKRGAKIFEANCQICHGKDGEGDGPLAKDLNYRPANLKLLSKRFPNHHFFIQVAKGKGNMPSWEDALTNKDLWDLTHFIQSLGE